MSLTSRFHRSLTRTIHPLLSRTTMPRTLLPTGSRTLPCVSFSTASATKPSSSASTVTPSSPAPSIPVIDLKSTFWKTGTPADKKRIAKQIDQACREIGFFTIVNHNIPLPSIERMWKVTEQYFDLPVAEKQKIHMTHDYPYGYSGFKEENLSAGYGTQGQPDLKECFAIGPINHIMAGMSEVKWPQQPVEFKNVWCEYYTNMEKLAAHLLSLIAIGLDLPPTFFNDKITAHRSALRALNYPKQDVAPEPGQIRAGAHTDYGTITILRQDMTGGLQVLNRAKQWQHVTPTPDSFIINLGDLMSRWTNDEYVSTLHRVIQPPGMSPTQLAARRQSIAFFHNLNGEAVVECIPTCQSSEKPAKYEAVNAWEWLIQKHSTSVGMENNKKK